MKKTKLPFFALLLLPATTFADTFAIDWSGQIGTYGAVGSAYPQSLSDTNISGVIMVNTDLLPAADPGNPPGVVSFSGSGYLQSSVRWTGGLFLPEPPGSSGSNALSLDSGSNQCAISDSGLFTDSLGAPHVAQLSLSFMGLDRLGTSLGLGSLGAAFNATGQFSDQSLDANGALQAFVGDFRVDKITVNAMAAPEIDPTSALSGLSLLAGALAVMRGRRSAAS